jgi:hypothetical protein
MVDLSWSELLSALLSLPYVLALKLHAGRWLSARVMVNDTDVQYR